MHPHHIHCKNTKDVQCKKQLCGDGNVLFSHPRGLTGQQPRIPTAWGAEKGRLIDLLSFPTQRLRVDISSAPPTRQRGELDSG